jgi:hypothetical protein
MGARKLHHTQTYQNLAFGAYGFRLLTASETSLSGEHFGALQVVADAVITATSNCTGGDASVTSLSLTAGTTIFGDWSDVTVASGTVMGYLR